LRVYDIFAEASEYLGTNDQTHVFRTCTRATEYLAAKGDWDVLKGYVDLPVQHHNLVVLPRQVETPLKWTIDGVPAFSRDRLYEFTLNGFGSNGGGQDRTETSWEDRGFVPFMVLPSANGFGFFKVTVSYSPRNAGQKVYIAGKVAAFGGTEVTETLTISANQWVTSTYEYSEVTEINKDVTHDYVGIYIHETPPQQLPPFGPTDMTPPSDSPDALHMPLMAPNSGSYRYPLRVIIETADRIDGLTLMYTLDGTDPTVTNGIPIDGWAGEVVVTQSPQVVKACEVLDGVAGPIKANTYTVTGGGILNLPIIRPDSGRYPLPLLVAIDAVDPNTGITLMYTTDGSDPSLTNGIPVAGWHAELTISAYPAVVKACEIERNNLAGPIAGVAYGLNPPIIQPPSGSYQFPLTANISAQDQLPPTNVDVPAPVIGLVYTIDGTDPSATNGLPVPSDGNVIMTTAPVVLKACQLLSGVAGPIARADYSAGVQPPPGPDPTPPQPVPPTPPQWTLLAIYWPLETNPKYRMVRISQIGVRARFLFRRKVFKIDSMDDFIPIQSQLGFLTMVQAIQALRRKDLETAKALADAAVEITTDAQRATTGFIELATNTEVQEARNYQIFNRDSVIVMDIFDDVAKIMGNVGENVIFDTTTTALEILCNKGHYDGLTGYVDITTDGWRYVTLPRFVDQPVAIAVNGRPAFMRNKWSEFHLNGPGSDEYGGQHMGGAQFGSWYGHSGSGRWGQIHAWDSVGVVCTIAPLAAVSQLVAIPDTINDNGKTLRIYGYDETGKRIFDSQGDGYTVVCNKNKLVPNINTDQKIARIERITRQSSNGFVRLYAFDAAQQTTSVLLGYYYPDETEPTYFRIKLPIDARWIRLRYRKRTYKVTSIWQPLHLFSRTAIITMVRALKLLDTDPAAAEQMEQKAVKYLDDDQKARNPGESFQLQFNEDCGWNSNFILS